MLTTSLSVSYSQISIFDGLLSSPFNDWTERHVKQGFSWRPGSSSFKTLIHAGPTNVSISVLRNYSLRNDSVRSILVPFEVVSGASIEVASIGTSTPIAVDSGKYSLLYETGGLDSNYWVSFTFIPDGGQDPAILVQDDGLSPILPLLMRADAA